MRRVGWPRPIDDRGDAPPRCGACRHFEDDPRRLEAALPGLKVLSSAHASVRADDGLCAVHDRFTSARGGCQAFEREAVSSAARRQP